MTLGTTSLIQIDDSVSDAHGIIARMREIIFTSSGNPVVRDAAVIRARFRANNDVRYGVMNIVQFVKDKVRYIGDPTGIEHMTDPATMLEQIDRDGIAFGDCDDHVLLFASMVASIGVPVMPCAVKLSRDSDHFDHVIAVVQVDGKLHDIDLCAKGVQQPKYIERLF